MGNAYIAVAGQEQTYLTDTHDALRTLIRDLKAVKATTSCNPDRPRQAGSGSAG